LLCSDPQIQDKRVAPGVFPLDLIHSFVWRS
jgi:hypothetical protein